MRSYVLLGIDPATGKEIRKWVTGKDSRDIQKKKEAIRVQYAAGMISAKDTRLGHFALLWLNSKYPVSRTNENTRRMYEGAVQRISKALGQSKMSQLRPIHVQQYMANRGGRSGEIDLMTLRQICKAAIRNRYLQLDPTDGLTITYHKPVKRELEQYERDAIMAAKLHPNERAFILLALRCGLRKGEILALTREDIADRVRVTKAAVVGNKSMTIKEMPKSRAGVRSIPIPADAIGPIKSYSDTVDPGKPLFGIMGRTRYWRMWHHLTCMVNDAAGGKSHFDDKKRYRVIDERVLLEPWSAHIMRHTYCGDLVRSGYRLDEIKYLMGHSRVTLSLDVYTRVKGEAISAGKLNGKTLVLRPKLSQFVARNVAGTLQVEEGRALEALPL